MMCGAEQRVLDVLCWLKFPEQQKIMMEVAACKELWCLRKKESSSHPNFRIWIVRVNQGLER